MQDPTFQDVGAQVLQSFHTWVEQGAGATQAWSLEPVNYEGWRVNIDEGEGRKGWLLLRQSLHDPLLVLNIESDTSGGKGCWSGAEDSAVGHRTQHSGNLLAAVHPRTSMKQRIVISESGSFN